MPPQREAATPPRPAEQAAPQVVALGSRRWAWELGRALNHWEHELRWALWSAGALTGPTVANTFERLQQRVGHCVLNPQDRDAVLDRMRHVRDSWKSLGKSCELDECILGELGALTKVAVDCHGDLDEQFQGYVNTLCYGVDGVIQEAHELVNQLPVPNSLVSLARLSAHIDRAIHSQIRPQELNLHCPWHVSKVPAYDGPLRDASEMFAARTPNEWDTLEGMENVLRGVIRSMPRGSESGDSIWLAELERLWGQAGFALDRVVPPDAENPEHWVTQIEQFCFDQFDEEREAGEAFDVSLDPPQVLVRGTPIPLEPEHANALQFLKSQGDWVAYEKVNKHCDKLLPERPDRFVAALPEQVQPFVHCAPGKGIRLAMT